MSNSKRGMNVRIKILNAEDKQNRFHPDAELLYVMEGALKVELDDYSTQLQRGGILIANAYKAYRARIEGDTLYLRVTIPTQMVSEMTKTPRPFFWCDSTREENKRYETIRQVLKHLMSHYLSIQGQNDDFGYLALIYQLMDELTSNFMPRFSDRENVDEQAKYEDRIVQIGQYINQNYGAPISSRELSEKLYLSQGYLSRFFKKHYGMSFAEYLSGVRLSHAVEDLIYTDYPITRVAFDNGFSNVAAFNKVFRERFGGTPSSMRKQLRHQRQESERDSQVEKRLEHYLKTEGQEPEEASVYSEINADCSLTGGVPLQDAWQDMLNIGPAASLMRSDVQKQLLELHRLTNMRYVRFWSIFSSELLLDPNGSGNYNFSKLDSILDFLVEHGIKPHIELGMKPRRLLRNVQQAIEEEQAFPDWNAEVLEKVLDAMMRHLLRRYRRTELNTWRMELWLPEAAYGDGEREEAYFRTFNRVYRCVKRYADELKVGGCGLRSDSLEFHNFGTGFLRRWKNQPCLPDFLSAGCYAYKQGKIRQDQYSKRVTDNEYMLHNLQLVREVVRCAGLEELPLYVTEWNMTVSDRNLLNDTCFKGAYVVKNMLDTYGMSQCMAYFQGSDLVTEYFDSDGPFFGGRGLLSKDGVLKPALYALRFLKWLYGLYVDRGEHYLITTDGHNCYGIICHNQKVLNYNYYRSPEDQVEQEHLWKYFEDRLPLHLNLNLKDVADGEYQVKTYCINEQAGSPLKAWEEMGYERELSRNDVKYLHRVSSPRLSIQNRSAVQGRMTLELTLKPNEISFIRIRKVN